jgi:hypothetical protein
MNHQEKVAHFLNESEQRGIGRYTAAPPLYRLLWRMGIAIPPPHFMGFWGLALLMGVFFGVFWGLFMWFVLWRDDAMPLPFAIGSALLAGLLFGVIMAAYYRWRAGKLALPRWQDYPGEPPQPRH